MSYTHAPSVSRKHSQETSASVKKHSFWSGLDRATQWEELPSAPYFGALRADLAAGPSSEGCFFSQTPVSHAGSCVPLGALHVRVSPSFQEPTRQDITKRHRCSYSHFKSSVLFVSSEFLKCRLLKWLLAHPMSAAASRACQLPMERRQKQWTVCKSPAPELEHVWRAHSELCFFLFRYRVVLYV